MPQSKSGVVKSLANRYEQESNPQPIQARFRHRSPRPPPSEPVHDDHVPDAQGKASINRFMGLVDRSSSLGSSGLELHPLGTQGLSRRTPSFHELAEPSSDDEPNQLLRGSKEHPTTSENIIPIEVRDSILPNDSVHSSISGTLVGTSSGHPRLVHDVSSPSGSRKPPKAPRSVHYHKPSDPSPVGATTLFSRNAAPLSLPELDSYIESFPPVVFSRHSNDPREENGPSKTESSKFPPFELLANRTLVDLKNNRPEPPIWKDRNTLFGVVSLVTLLISTPLTLPDVIRSPDGSWVSWSVASRASRYYLF